VTPYEPVGWQPNRSRATRFIPALAVVAAVIAVGIIGLSGPPPCPLSSAAAPAGSSDASANAPCPNVPPSPLIGVVTSVDSLGLADIRGFDLRLADGSTVALKLGPLENATEFSPSHLTEHQATSVPIRAFYRLDEHGVPVVYRLEDAST
jgi:hypothetical protein